MKVTKNFFLKIVIIAIVIFSAWQVAARRSDILKIFEGSQINHTAISVTRRADKLDEIALFSEYEKLLKTIDPAREEYFQEGTVKIINEADSNILLPETTYQVARKGKKCYYKLGNTETFNMNGLYVYVDHGLKKVLLSAQKELQDQIFIGGKVPGQKLKEEGFKISALTDGSKRVLVLSNPSHTIYKEYSLTYHVGTEKVSKIFTRMANEREPYLKDKGRLIEVVISSSLDSSRINEYNPLKIVKVKDDGWELTSEFKKYELTAI